MKGDVWHGFSYVIWKPFTPKLLTMNITFLKEEIEVIRNHLIAEQQTLAVAESATSGLLQAAFSQATDARLFFQGGVTAFNVPQKCKLLDVEPIYALEHNGVSSKIAVQMAENVARLFNSQVAVAVTGYCAPVPEKGIDVPFAYYAIYIEGQAIEVRRIDGGKGTPLALQLYYVNDIISALRNKLRA